jgi:hypothetical protein
MKCPQCNGMKVVPVDEDGHRFEDACYHCGATGVVPDPTEKDVRNDRIAKAVHVVAARLIRYAQFSADTEPNGDGWAFGAAEGHIPLYQYNQMREYDAELRVKEALDSIEDTHVVDLLVEFILQEPAKTIDWFAKRWAALDAEECGVFTGYQGPDKPE